MQRLLPMTKDNHILSPSCDARGYTLNYGCEFAAYNLTMDGSTGDLSAWQLATAKMIFVGAARFGWFAEDEQ